LNWSPLLFGPLNQLLGLFTVFLGIVALVAQLGVVLPLFGVTSLIVPGLEWAVLRRWAVARSFLGLGPASAQ
jgi:hypothetical protein